MQATAEPELFDLLHRPGRGRWRKVAPNVTFAEAIGLIDGSGDWWVRRQRATVEVDEPELELGEAA